jgi:hypothetical protein
MSGRERFFQTDNKTYWRGSPDPERGEIFRLKSEQHKVLGKPYTSLHLGEVGRRGAPWGTLFLEVNDAVYHFSANVQALSRRAEDGLLDAEGKNQIARGTLGVLDCDIPWKWVQESVTITEFLTTSKLMRLKEKLEHVLCHQEKLPYYQAYQYALERGIEIDPTKHNCASFVAHCLDVEVPIEIARMPVLLFDHITSLVSRER